MRGKGWLARLAPFPFKVERAAAPAVKISCLDSWQKRNCHPKELRKVPWVL